MTPVIPQGLTGRVCPKSLGSCGQPSSSSEAVVRAVTQWLPEAGSTGWRCLDDGWAASNPHPRLPTEPRELMPAPQQSWSLSTLPPGLLRGMTTGIHCACPEAAPGLKTWDQNHRPSLETAKNLSALHCQ